MELKCTLQREAGACSAPLSPPAAEGKSLGTKTKEAVPRCPPFTDSLLGNPWRHLISVGRGPYALSYKIRGKAVCPTQSCAPLCLEGGSQQDVCQASIPEIVGESGQLKAARVKRNILGWAGLPRAKTSLMATCVCSLGGQSGEEGFSNGIYIHFPPLCKKGRGWSLSGRAPGWGFSGICLT